MRIDHVRDGDCLTVRLLDRRMDARAVVDLREQVRAILCGDERVLLDLSDIDFIDSTGLGAILSILKMVGVHGDLAIAGARQPVLELIRLTNMDRVLRLVRAGDSDEVAAPASLSAAAP